MDSGTRRKAYRVIAIMGLIAALIATSISLGSRFLIRGIAYSLLGSPKPPEVPAGPVPVNGGFRHPLPNLP